MTRELIELLPDLRCIVTTGAANRSIDLEAAADDGVVVSGTTNGHGCVATAELTWSWRLPAASPSSTELSEPGSGRSRSAPRCAASPSASSV